MASVHLLRRVEDLLAEEPEELPVLLCQLHFAYSLVPVLCSLFSSFPRCPKHFIRNHQHPSPEDIWPRFGAQAPLVNGSQTPILPRNGVACQTTIAASHRLTNWFRGGDLTATRDRGNSVFDRTLLHFATAASLAEARLDSTKICRASRAFHGNIMHSFAICRCQSGLYHALPLCHFRRFHSWPHELPSICAVYERRGTTRIREIRHDPPPIRVETSIAAGLVSRVKMPWNRTVARLSTCQSISRYNRSWMDLRLDELVRATQKLSSNDNNGSCPISNFLVLFLSEVYENATSRMFDVD